MFWIRVRAFGAPGLSRAGALYAASGYAASTT